MLPNALQLNPLIKPCCEIGSRCDDLAWGPGENPLKGFLTFPGQYGVSRTRRFLSVLTPIRELPGIPVHADPRNGALPVPLTREGVQKNVRCGVGDKPQST